MWVLKAVALPLCHPYCSATCNIVVPHLDDARESAQFEKAARNRRDSDFLLARVLESARSGADSVLRRLEQTCKESLCRELTSWSELCRSSCRTSARGGGLAGLRPLRLDRLALAPADSPTRRP